MAKFNRKKAEEYMISIMNGLDKSGRNAENIKKVYASMSDKQFHDMMLAIAENKAHTPFIYDSDTDTSINLEHVVNFGEKKLGIKFRQRIRYKNSTTGEYYWSNSERWVLDVPVRRLIQSIENKISISTSNQVNVATNQPVGDNKGASLSGPEVLILAGQGFDNTVNELMVIRGGDLKAKHAMEQSILGTGGASLGTSLSYGTGAKAVQTVGLQLTAMHWRNNLKEN